MGLGLDYRILPFKGLYRYLTAPKGVSLRCPIYPAPDLAFPFLGVHLTPTLDHKITIGPSAIPGFSRENYSVWDLPHSSDGFGIAWDLAKMMLNRESRLLPYALNELRLLNKWSYAKELARMSDLNDPKWIGPLKKVGIRAQLFNFKTQKLEMDFLTERSAKTYHILNAISPAFTSCFAFADHVVSDMLR